MMLKCFVSVVVLAAADPGCSPEDGCTVTSLLQKKGNRKLTMPSEEEPLQYPLEETFGDDGSMDSRPELSFRQEGGMTIETHGKFQIRTVADSVSASATQDKKWIISFRGGCPFSDLEQVESALLPEMKEEFMSDSEHGGIPVLVMQGSQTSLKKGLDRIASGNIKNVIIEEDVEVHIDPAMNAWGDASVANTAEPKSWGLDRIDDRSGLDNSFSPPAGLTGKDVNVFVLDTGIRTTHTDFEGRAIPTLETWSGTPVECNGDETCATDRHGHGTHCAGTIGGKAYGVATQSKLFAMKVLSDNGRGSSVTTIEAMDWVKKSGYERKIISASLGSGRVVQAYRNAVDEVTSAGVVVVVAAGNGNDDACGNSPAHVPSAITVGATDSADFRASFSSYGSCVDILAPGVYIPSDGHSSDTSTATMSGTSMACPHVAGAAALIISEDPTRTVAEVDQVLKMRATPDKIKATSYMKGITETPNRLLYIGLETGSPTPVPTPVPVPSPFPPSQVANCGFETPKEDGAYCGLWHDTGDWHEHVEHDQFDWSQGSSRYLGGAAEGSKYLYIDTSSPRVGGDSAILQTGPLNVTAAYVMHFKYNMPGYYVGSLVVKVNDAEVWSESGNQGNGWKSASIDLSPHTGTNPRIAFVGIRGLLADDLAIDKVDFIETTAAPTPAPTPVPAPMPVASCGFETPKEDGAYCGLWHDAVGDQFDWSQTSQGTGSGGTGPLGAVEGSKYLYIETSSPRRPGDVAILETGPLIVVADLAMRFKYHMYDSSSSSMGSLTVEVDGAKVWSKSGNQGDVWMTASIELGRYKGTNPSIAFVGTRGSSWKGDAAIDEVEFVPTGTNGSAS